MAGWLEHFGDAADSSLLREAIARCQDRLEADQATRWAQRELGDIRRRAGSTYLTAA